MTPEMINAIASLWKLVAAIAVLFTIFLFRKPITDRLGRLSRVKTKDTEVDFEGISKGVEEKLESMSQPSKPVEEKTDKDKELISGINPQLNTKEDLFDKMINAFFEKDSEKAKNSFDALQSSEPDLNQRLKNEVLYNYFSYTKLQKLDSINELLRLSNINEVRSFALNWLSQCYEFDNAFEKAKSTLRQSLEASTSSEMKAVRAKAMIELLLKTESPINEAFEVLDNVISTIPKKDLAPVYLAYAEIYKKTENKLLRAIALEKATETNPNDTSEIFNAAYAQSEAELSALAITNYGTVIRQNPDYKSALNNIGVEYDNLDMPIQSIIFYKQASDKNETLAMSNIAYKLIGQGLISEAEELLKLAQQQEDVHPNVLEAIASIEKRKDLENKKKEDIARAGIKQKNFINNYAEARFTQKYEEGVFKGTWKYNSDSILIEEKENSISAEWGKAPNKRRLKGGIVGCSIDLVFENQIAWMTSESYSAANKVLCYISSDRKTIHIMTLSKDKPEFMEFVLESR